MTNIVLGEVLLQGSLSDAYALVPSYYVLRGTSSLSLHNCTVITLCSSLQSLLNWVLKSPLGTAFPSVSLDGLAAGRVF